MQDSWQRHVNPRVVHVHGNNGVRFQGLGPSLRRGHPSYEEWYNPTSRWRGYGERRGAEGRSDFHAQNLGGENRGRQQQQPQQQHVYQAKVSRPGGSDSHSNSNFKTGSTCTGSHKVSSSSGGTGSRTYHDHNVKDSSAVILTPDTIVYNDNCLWTHKYDSSPNRR